MKNNNKLVSVIMATAMLATPVVTLTGCQKESDSLQLGVLNAGYGVQWLYDLADGYNAKNPDVKVEISEYNGQGGEDKYMVDELLSGSTDIDVYFGRDSMYKYMDRSQSAGGKTYDRIMYNLTDFYNSQNPYDNNKTIASKINPEILEQISVMDNNKETQYTLPWVMDALGIVYNVDKFTEFGLTVPNTTNELIALCDDIYNNTKNTNHEVSAFVDSLADSYMYIPLESWITHYEGYDAIYGEEGLWEGYSPDGEENVHEVLAYNGIEKAYEVFYNILSPKDANGNKHIKGLEKTFNNAQLALLEGDACMMMNGAWLQREMETYTGNANIQMMKTPVLSAIVEKLEYRDGTNYMSDEMLSAVIAAIDGGATTYEGVSANDMARLIEARGLVYSWTFGHTAWIPTYSNKVDTAKDFLYYMVSDEGMRIFNTATKGCTQPYKFDYLNDATTSKNMNNFMKGIYNRNVGATKLLGLEMAKDPLFSRGGVTLNYQWGSNEVKMLIAFTGQSGKTYTAKEYKNERLTMYQGRWAEVLNLSGIK